MMSDDDRRREESAPHATKKRVDDYGLPDITWHEEEAAENERAGGRDFFDDDRRIRFRQRQ